MTLNEHSLRAFAFCACAFLFSGSVAAQVASGLLDPNVATLEELVQLPGATPEVATALRAARPLEDALERADPPVSPTPV